MFFLHQHYRASYLTSEIHMIHMEFHRNHIMPVGPQWPGPGPINLCNNNTVFPSTFAGHSSLISTRVHNIKNKPLARF